MQWTERIESLKAGALSAIATGGLTLGFMGLDTWTGPPAFLPDIPVSDVAIPDMAVRLGIALISGFLFGVTYRYIIRQDESSHLKSGAVLAFAFVRGLARIDQRGLVISWEDWSWGDWSLLQTELLVVLGVLAQSWALFALARWFLDASLRRGWLQYFQS